MRNSRIITSLLTICSVTITAGCFQKQNEYVPPPPPEVNVQKPLVQKTTVYMEFPGRVRAFETNKIVARVPGFLKTREFQAGQFVKEG